VAHAPKAAVPPLVVREAASAEIDRIRALYTQCGYAGAIPVGDRFVVAEIADALVGVVRLSLEHGVLVLRTMRVLPSRQRQGIGSAMLAAFARALGGRECFCLAYGHLQRFYGQIGFETIDPRRLPLHLSERLSVYRHTSDVLPMRRPPNRLDTARLALRPMAAEDAPEMRRQWNDRDVGRYLWDGQPVARAAVDRVIAASADSFARRGFGLWAVALKPDGPLAGFCGLRTEAESTGIELLFAIDRPLWGRGLATEAAHAVVSHAFDDLGLSTLTAAANPANAASCRVLEKIGMRPTGRQHTAVEELVIYGVQPATRYDRGR
jgi:RimJ/RimL family protein N-acetyltransferase